MIPARKLPILVTRVVVDDDLFEQTRKYGRLRDGGKVRDLADKDPIAILMLKHMRKFFNVLIEYDRFGNLGSPFVIIVV